jgi:hypothetical protein
MQRVWRADPRKVRELLGALEGALSGLGYVRRAAVFTRVREPGVVHLFEVVRLRGAFAVNAGVIFEEVLEVARAAGDDWYLFSGVEPRLESPSYGMCQLVANIGHFAEPSTDMTWKIEEASSSAVVESIVTLALRGASTSMERLGTRSALLDRWRERVVPAQIRFALDDEVLAASRISTAAVVEVMAKQEVHHHPRFTGLMFWLGPTVLAAIVSHRCGLLEQAREILVSEEAAVRPYRPVHADFLLKVMKLLGIASNRSAELGPR